MSTNNELSCSERHRQLAEKRRVIAEQSRVEADKIRMVEKEYIYELYKTGFWENGRPQVYDDFQKSKEIENSENLESKFDIRAAEGMVFATIISISIWVLIISFISWVIS